MTGKESPAKETTAHFAPKRSGRGIYSVLLTLLLAFTLRMLFFQSIVGHPERFFQVDSSQYHSGAMNLLQHHLLPQNLDRPPAYLVFLAIVYAALGPLPTSAIVVQILVSTLTVALAHFLGWLWGGRRTGVITAILISVEAGSVLYANQVMTETLFSFIFVGGMVIWSMMIQRKRWQYGLLSGVALGFAVLVRPVLFYLGSVIGLLSFLLYRGSRRERWLAALSVIIAFVLAITPWMGRNYAVTGVAQFRSNQGVTLLLYNVRQLRAYQQGISAEAAHAQLLDEVQQETSEAVRQDPMVLESYYQQKAIAEIRANLGDYILVHLKGSALFFFIPTGGVVARALGWVRTGTGLQANLMTRGLVETLRSFRDFRDQVQISSGDLLFFGVVGYEMAYLLVLNAGAVWGAIKCLRARRWDLLLLTAVTIGYFALITGPLSYDARYRIPVIPFLALLAAVAFSQIRSKTKGVATSKYLAKQPQPTIGEAGTVDPSIAEAPERHDGHGSEPARLIDTAAFWHRRLLGQE